MRQFSTTVTEYTVRDDGIVIGREINLDVPRTEQVVRESLDRLSDETHGARPPGLWDARSTPEFPIDLWLAFIARIEPVVGALAILVDERTAELMGPFPAAMDSLLLPVQVFHDEDTAIEWLKQFVDRDVDLDL